jgi:hypothetical protein
MSFAPQHDWEGYATRTSVADAAWIRSLSVSDRFDIYADMFNLAWEARRASKTGDWAAMDEWRWQQKLAQRMKCVEAYQRMDGIRNARAAARNTD